MVEGFEWNPYYMKLVIEMIVPIVVLEVLLSYLSVLYPLQRNQFFLACQLMYFLNVLEVSFQKCRIYFAFVVLKNLIESPLGRMWKFFVSFLYG